MEFATIASGSSGNCVYIGTEYTKILIDAGISGKSIDAGLKAIGVKGEDIDGLFITHEHDDHIKGAGIFSRKYGTPIYATYGTWLGGEHKMGKLNHLLMNTVTHGENVIINDLCIKPFNIPHDAKEPVGYCISSDKFKITTATDIGHVTKTLMDNLAESNILLLESNHDLDMLENGPYSEPLKRRIRGDKGHLCNENAGKLLACVMSGKLSYVRLGHLSIENNTEQLAYETVEKILNRYKIKVGTYLDMAVAARAGVTEVIELK
ncbi:MAG: MBL fold metallo-hydrolase [Clostridiales bacterium]|nr:MBL fold metallo-hydrolase [Clostridiales bacterium]MCD8214444.1 MBL fold metallo-hydrolase [Clostridiales bacterium]